MSLELFLHQTHKDIENKITEQITDRHILQILKGGKRLRPLLSSIVFKVCTRNAESDELYQQFLEGAVAIELAHSASLVHDDIIDGDLNRRGEPAFYIKTGIDNAILIGHKMLTLGFSMALSHGQRVGKLYVDAWNETLNGQLSEIHFNSDDLRDTAVSADSKFFQIYSRIIDQKTATLFAAACKAAAIWAKAEEKIVDLFYDYGREVGFAYQLADDLVDLEKGEMIDSVVIPLLSRLEKKNVKNGTLKAKTIKKKLKSSAPEIKDLYINEITKHILNAKEMSISSVIPESRFKPYLKKAPLYIINKMLEEIDVRI